MFFQENIELCMSLILFEETPEQKFDRMFSEMKNEISNVRRGLFARHSELERKYQETYFELETLKESIAKQDIKIWTSRSSSITQQKKQKLVSRDLFTFI